MNLFRTTESGYRYNQILIYSAFFVILAGFFYVLYLNAFDFKTNIYIKCDLPFCENPLVNMPECSQELKILWFIPIYKTEDCRASCTEWWCTSPSLPKGEYGKKPSFLQTNFSFIGMAIFLLALVLNHLWFNKGKKVDFEMRISKKLIINRRWIENRSHENKDNSDN